MRAMDVMVRDVVTASPDEDVEQVIDLLAKHDASTLPVVDDEGNVIDDPAYCLARTLGIDNKAIDFLAKI